MGATTIHTCQYGDITRTSKGVEVTVKARAGSRLYMPLIVSMARFIRQAKPATKRQRPAKTQQELFT